MNALDQAFNKDSDHAAGHIFDGIFGVAGDAVAGYGAGKLAQQFLVKYTSLKDIVNEPVKDVKTIKTNGPHGEIVKKVTTESGKKYYVKDISKAANKDLLKANYKMAAENGLSPEVMIKGDQIIM